MCGCSALVKQVQNDGQGDQPNQAVITKRVEQCCQIQNNTPEQAMLGDFSKAVDDAVMDSKVAHQNQMMQLLSDPAKAAHFSRIVFDLLKMAEGDSSGN